VAMMMQVLTIHNELMAQGLNYAAVAQECLLGFPAWVLIALSPQRPLVG
jgi:hypothetical protein